MSFLYHDSRTDRTVRLAPHGRPYATVYVCGPTVYAPAHVGHGRTYLAFDLVRRYLRETGVPTRHVMNITDVEDKIDVRARELGLSPIALARREERRFFDELDALDVIRPSYAPRASDWVPRMVRLGRQLARRGHVERRGNAWWYSAPPGHARLNFPMAAQVSRHAVREPPRADRPVGPDPRDFMIWKLQETPGPTWPSPWGRGVPGWHLECYAMAQHYLGIPIDLQGGGQDLVFPHHYAQNEIALTLEGTPFARGFLHSGFVREGGEKISKSTGNLVPLGPAIRQHGASGLRWYLLGRAYAEPIDWCVDDIDRSDRELGGIRTAIRRSIAPGAGGSVSAARAARFARDVERAIGANLGIDRAFDRIRRWTEYLDGQARSSAASGERGGVRDAYQRVERLTGLDLVGPR